MRALIGIASLLVVLAIVGVLAKKQLAATQAPAPALQAPGTAAPTGTVREQSQQIPQQVQQQMEGLMQKSRPLPGDESK
jgi:hypothetical protein